MVAGTIAPLERFAFRGAGGRGRLLPGRWEGVGAEVGERPLLLYLYARGEGAREGAKGAAVVPRPANPLSARADPRTSNLRCTGAAGHAGAPPGRGWGVSAEVGGGKPRGVEEN